MEVRDQASQTDYSNPDSLPFTGLGGFCGAEHPCGKAGDFPSSCKTVSSLQMCQEDSMVEYTDKHVEKPVYQCFTRVSTCCLMLMHP
jgi:hypothetical protein